MAVMTLPYRLAAQKPYSAEPIVRNSVRLPLE